MPARSPSILVVEDSKADLFLIREALAGADIDARLSIAQDGHEALDYIDTVERNSDECSPDLVLLDLNLPRKDGLEVLRHLRGSAACGDVPVLIVSSSDSLEDIAAASSLRFSGYFRKPSVYADFMKLGPLVRDLLSGRD